MGRLALFLEFTVLQTSDYFSFPKFIHKTSTSLFVRPMLSPFFFTHTHLLPAVEMCTLTYYTYTVCAHNYTTTTPCPLLPNQHLPKPGIAGTQPYRGAGHGYVIRTVTGEFCEGCEFEKKWRKREDVKRKTEEKEQHEEGRA